MDEMKCLKIYDSGYGDVVCATSRTMSQSEAHKFSLILKAILSSSSHRVCACRVTYHSDVSQDPLFLLFGALVRTRDVFWSFWWPLMIELGDDVLLCLVGAGSGLTGLSQWHGTTPLGRSSMHAPLFTWITTPDINSCTHFTSRVWFIASLYSPQLQLLQSPSRQNAGQGCELHFSRFSFTVGFLLCAHFLGEKARMGSPRTQRIMGCWVPPPHDLLHGVNPINFHAYFRFLRPVAVDVVWLALAAFSL